jgi:hypothetical protein
MDYSHLELQSSQIFRHGSRTTLWEYSSCEGGIITDPLVEDIDNFTYNRGTSGSGQKICTLLHKSVYVLMYHESWDAPNFDYLSPFRILFSLLNRLHHIFEWFLHIKSNSSIGWGDQLSLEIQPYIAVYQLSMQVCNNEQIWQEMFIFNICIYQYRLILAISIISATQFTIFWWCKFLEFKPLKHVTMHADMAELASWAFVQICIKSTQHMKKGKKSKER